MNIRPSTLAIEGSYRPLWSSAILDELEEQESLKHVSHGIDRDEARRRAAHLIEQMRLNFDDAEIRGWEKLEGSYGLPDADDEHVVAAAEIGGAGVIVTENFRDMPIALIPTTIQLQTPAEFALNTVAINPAAALRAVQMLAKRFRNPPQTADQLLKDLVNRYGFTDAVELIRDA
jgi:PIN domain